ncbi:transcriptional regulator-like protein [Lentisphaera araneosa HTCC2155]|uniref:Transcriptional regulator-like protein n=1 Tax=Lentisphaera araneosa HTCC2155 TaxID=313628 RepID=A6DKJ3_9BACT|nr:helix-turn-helix domain-containing protein [Lentisphaera araneosa]EDM27891.1 transcriptional regulator-like protein [Lentisphaera araneosa HTCC2155]
MSRIAKEAMVETQALYDLGLVPQSDYEKMMKLTARDVKIPEPVKFTPSKIIQLRKSLRVSQQVFANVVGVTSGTVSKWERGESQPEKVACRFLKVLEKEGMEAIK